MASIAVGSRPRARAGGPAARVLLNGSQPSFVQESGSDTYIQRAATGDRGNTA